MGLPRYGGRIRQTRFNSPRILQQIEGDFTAIVCVTAYWDRGIVEGGYNGAGLVVWDSESQYLRLEHNRTNFGKGGFSFSTPLYNQNNRRVFYISTREEFFKGDSTWLRIVRQESKIIIDISHDGQRWIRTGVVDTEFADTVHVGIHATNSTGRKFAVRYDQLSVMQH